MRIPLFEGSQNSPAFPSDKSSINMKMNKEYWWNDAGRGKRSTGRET
jgi:hypothetical protein